MKKQEQGQFQTNEKKRNAGFSLVEVIIAMTVLAIISIPLCHSFITAARTNAKARKQASANTVAQSVMEGLRSTNYGDLDTLFSEDTSVSDFYLTTNCKEKGVVEADDETGVVADTLSYYKIGGISEDNYVFDVKITIDTSMYTKDEYDLTPATSVVNNPMALLPMYNSDKDYLFADTETKARAAFSSLATTVGSTVDALWESKLVSTETDITVSMSGEDSVIVSGTITYTYNSTGSSYTRSIDAAQISLEDFRNVYICYVPHYGADYTGACSDVIHVSNPDNLSFGLYVIKQQITETTSEDDIAGQNLETNYAPTLEIEEGPTSGTCQIDVYTNFETNIVTDTALTTDNAHYQYTYTGTGDAKISTNDDASAKEIINPQSYETTGAHDLFQATVEVYESDVYDDITIEENSALQHVVSLTSGT